MVPHLSGTFICGVNSRVEYVGCAWENLTNLLCQCQTDSVTVDPCLARIISEETSANKQQTCIYLTAIRNLIVST